MPFDDTTGFQVEDTTLNDLEVLRKVKASLSADHAWCRDKYVEVLDGPADLSCHMSPGFPDDRERQRSCTGVAMFRANAQLVPAGRGAFEAMRETGTNRKLVFSTINEFLRHHRRKP